MDKNRIKTVAAMISEMAEIDVCIEEDNKLESLSLNEENKMPLMISQTLRNTLKEKATKQKLPVIMEFEENIYFGTFFNESDSSFYFCGPFSTQTVGNIQRNKFKKNYSIPKDNPLFIPIISYTKILIFLELLFFEITGIHLKREQLISVNRFCNNFQQDHKENKVLFHLEQDESITHHTYEDECQLLNYVQQGQGRLAIGQSMKMDQQIPSLANKPKEHYIKVAIAAITLCTRAAIKGGFSPSDAYEISDYYMHQLDNCNNVPELIECRNKAIWELCESVRKQHINNPKTYVEQCKDYIKKNIGKKIYVSDIALGLGISESHISKRFSEQEGMTIQEYIVQYRIRKAKELLQYTNMSITEISETLNFTNPSYFSKIFKRQNHMTPQQYRNTSYPTEYKNK